MLPFTDAKLTNLEILAVEADPNAYRGHIAAAISLGGLLSGFLCCVAFAEDVRFSAPRHEVRAPVVDEDAREAIALVQDWKLTGDEKAVAQRLAGTVGNPYYPRAWSAEKTGTDSYLVIFRVPAGTPVYAFEVSLKTQSVEATFEARDRLTILRVHEDAESRLLASVN